MLNTSSQQSLASDILNAMNLVDSIGKLYNLEHSVLGSSQQANLAREIGVGNGQYAQAHTYIESDQIKIVLQNGAQSRGMTLSQYLEL